MIEFIPILMGRDRRQWCYIQRPAVYEIAGCICGNLDPDWSEFVDCLWCARCQIDFVPVHWGLFDGPILLEACRLLGIVFDRVEIGTKRIVRFGDPEWETTRP